MAFEQSSWQLVRRPLGPNLYSGTTGIALFLSHLSRHSADPIFRKTAEGAIRYAISHLDRLMATGNFGFYSGATGLAYVLAQMAAIFGTAQLAEQGLAILRQLADQQDRYSALGQWDVISGSAGLIPVFLKLHAWYGERFLLDSAVFHGDILLERAIQSEQGWSWSQKEFPGHNNLTGFSHGTAGVAWSLVELHKITGNHSLLAAAQEAFRYERHWYDPEWENWPDFRTLSDSGQPGYVAAWCHGAPGIGLSRIRAFQLLGDRDCRIEAEIAVRTTTRALYFGLSNNQGNYSLCHGHCGNAELLLCAGDVLGDEASMNIVHEMGIEAIQKYSVEKKPWPCGVTNAGETPDLMLGLAGIGYFYLRLYDRQRTPSVLLVGPSKIRNYQS
ncbi:MAG TPA: lanthionine synthetase LanC family protein [Candidatus Angelobacter sp.]|nr:lanthionine synthetase LanC family protein [Candidatus Angelobacter sp.]